MFRGFDEDSPPSLVEESSSSPCSPKVFGPDDIPKWLNSEGYYEYTDFLQQLNEYAKSFCNDPVEDEKLLRVVNMLEKLSTIIDHIPPIQDDKNQRYIFVENFLSQ